VGEWKLMERYLSGMQAVQGEVVSLQADAIGENN
jgi:hypothetical protein